MELKLIPGTLGFYASGEGDIYDSQKIKRKTYLNSDCYATASVLVRKNKWVTFGTHRLVCLAFHGEPKEGFDQVNHRNGNVRDNRPVNVEWVSVYENNIHAEIMRTDNHRPSIIASYDDSQHTQVMFFKNAWEASERTGFEALAIWDSIKDNTCIDEVPQIGFALAPSWRFTFHAYSDNIPEDLKKHRVVKRGADGRACETPVKSLEIETGFEKSYSSMRVAADYHKTCVSHIHQAIPKREGVFRAFRKQFLFAYDYQDFPELTEEDIERIQKRGPRSVAAYNTNEKRMYIFSSATEFIAHGKLSKKAVSVALARNRLRDIDNWVALYLNDENVRDILAFVNGSSQDKPPE